MADIDHLKTTYNQCFSKEQCAVLDILVQVLIDLVEQHFQQNDAKLNPETTQQFKQAMNTALNQIEDLIDAFEIEK